MVIFHSYVNVYQRVYFTGLKSPPKKVLPPLRRDIKAAVGLATIGFAQRIGALQGEDICRIRGPPGDGHGAKSVFSCARKKITRYDRCMM